MHKLTSPRNSVDPQRDGHDNDQDCERKRQDGLIDESLNIFSRGSDTAPVVAHKPIGYDDNDHSDIDYRVLPECPVFRPLKEQLQSESTRGVY